MTCHLGAGSSITAVVDGRSVDTTMGFTPNEGVPMATRSGSVDAGLVTWLLAQGITATELDDGLQHRSGLLGLAGTSDMQAVTAAATAGDERAQLAVAVWIHRVAQAIAAMATAAGGLDAVTFTGGIGEHAPELRRDLVAALGWLGLAIDPDANEATRGDHDVTGAGSSARVLVVTAREDLEIARGTRAALSPPS